MTVLDLKSTYSITLLKKTSFKICLSASWTIELQRDIVEQGRDLAEEGYIGCIVLFFHL